MDVTLRYFTEFGKPALQKTICVEFLQEFIVFCSACTTSSQRKFTFVISSPDEFLVSFLSPIVLNLWISFGHETITSHFP